MQCAGAQGSDAHVAGHHEHQPHRAAKVGASKSDFEVEKTMEIIRKCMKISPFQGDSRQESEDFRRGSCCFRLSRPPVLLPCGALGAMGGPPVGSPIHAGKELRSWMLFHGISSMFSTKQHRETYIYNYKTHNIIYIIYIINIYI